MTDLDLREQLRSITDPYALVDFLQSNCDADEVSRMLDGWVHGAKAHQAEVINNQGLGHQIPFLHGLPGFLVHELADELFPANGKTRIYTTVQVPVGELVGCGDIGKLLARKVDMPLTDVQWETAGALPGEDIVLFSLRAYALAVGDTVLTPKDEQAVITELAPPHNTVIWATVQIEGRDGDFTFATSQLRRP